MENKKTKNQKGIFFTLAIVLLIIPLLLLLSFYLNLSRTKITEKGEKMRCEELHYWVEDIKRDLQRAVVIFGRRAAIYSLGEVVEQERGLENYTLNCTSLCGISCSEFSYEEKGAEAALTELVLCGTFKGRVVTYMENHTLREWVEKILQKGEEMHYLTNITPTDLKIIPKDAWNFAIIMDLEIKASDEGGMCFYQETPTSVMSITSIVGLEDPLYPLNTDSMVIKYIYNCSIEINLTEVIGSGSSGEGSGTGDVILYSNLEGSVEERVCGVPDKENKIIVFDQAFGIINNQGIEDCLNEFAGVIDYQDVGSDPNITSPYVYGTGDLNLNDSDCIGIRNTEDNHEILQGIPLDELNTNCYEISNLEGLGENCTEKYPEGGSFFDRLDGNYFLGEKYVNQSREYFGVTKIGLESIIDIYELYYHLIPINENATWIDYLYWQDVEGIVIGGICSTLDYKFRLDCQHWEKYVGTTTTTTTTTTSTTTTISSTTTTTTTTSTTLETATSTTTTTTTSTTIPTTTTTTLAPTSTTTSTTLTTTSTTTSTISTTTTSTSTSTTTTVEGW